MPSFSNSGVGKLGRRCRLDGRSLRNKENLVRTSGNPSRYHRGEWRYMGGETRKNMAGLAVQAAPRAVQKSSRTGSILLDTTESSSEDAKKLVTHDTMHTLLSFRIWPRAASSSSSFMQVRTWQPNIWGQARVFVFVMFRFTFESPKRVKTRAWAIFAVDGRRITDDGWRRTDDGWRRMDEDEERLRNPWSSWSNLYLISWIVFIVLSAKWTSYTWVLNLGNLGPS